MNYHGAMKEDTVNGATMGESSAKFLTSHAAILLAIARNPDQTLRVMCREVGVTERRAAQIIRELREGSYIATERLGRRSRYTINHNRLLDDAFAREITVGAFIRAFSS